MQKQPATIFALERIFRDQRFRNGQWVHFLFDVTVLNRPPDKEVRAYVMGNIEQDPAMRAICARLVSREELRTAIQSGGRPESDDAWKELVGTFKQAILFYIRKPSAVTARLGAPSFETERKRIAEYLIREFGLDKMGEGEFIRKIASTKRRPRDIRGIHGDYGQERVKEAFASMGISQLSEAKETGYLPQQRLKGVTTTGGKEKVFDFLVYRSREPCLAVETNFYESEGTKININVAEYESLSEEVERKSAARFVWVTDGPVWLSHGRTRDLRQLYTKFEGRIFNYITLGRDLEGLLAKVQ